MDTLLEALEMDQAELLRFLERLASQSPVKKRQDDVLERLKQESGSLELADVARVFARERAR